MPLLADPLGKVVEFEEALDRRDSGEIEAELRSDFFDELRELRCAGQDGSILLEHRPAYGAQFAAAQLFAALLWCGHIEIDFQYSAGFQQTLANVPLRMTGIARSQNDVVILRRQIVESVDTFLIAERRSHASSTSQ